MSNKIFFTALSLTLIFFFPACQPNPFQEGERLYQANCANCHMDGGEGLSALIPPLEGSDYLEKNRDKLPCILRYGLKDTITVNGKIYAEAMPGVSTLTDIHITNILNYIDSKWGRGMAPYQLGEVQKLLENCRQ